MTELGAGAKLSTEVMVAVMAAGSGLETGPGAAASGLETGPGAAA